MTDAQYLLDLAVKQYNEVADSMEKHFDTVADQLREWMPNVRLQLERPPPPPPPKRILAMTKFQALQRWAVQHQAIAAGFLAFFGSGAVYFWLQRTSGRRKRRARRSANGARTEAVIICGSLTSPLTLDLALGLERKGFLVYIAVSHPEDEQAVKDLSKIDIIPICLESTSNGSSSTHIQRLRIQFAKAGQQTSGVSSGINLSGLIINSHNHFELAPIQHLEASQWRDALNDQVIAPLDDIRSILPLVTEFKSRVVHLTPSVPTALRLPHHALTNTVSGAVQAYGSTLAAELREAGVGYSHVRLGDLHIPESASASASASISPSHQKKRKSRSTHARYVHDSVFDALHTSSPNGTWYVGRGSRTYGLLGAIAPARLIAWIWGQRQKTNRAPHSTSGPASLTSAASTSPVRLLTESEDEASDASREWERVQAESVRLNDKR